MEMEKLPTEIATNIFSRLPFDSVIHCKCVSKSWCNLLEHFIHSSDLYFAKLHRHRRLIKNHHLKSSSLPDSVLFLLDQSTDDTEQQLHYAEYNEEDKKEGGGGGGGFNCKVIKKFNCPLEMNSKFWTMATSSNGLICSVYQTDRLCIYNPFLGEYVALPDKQQMLIGSASMHFGFYRIPSTDEYKVVRIGSSFMAFGFGHINSADEYKVVRIVYPPDGGDVGNVEVYTLGKSTHWRSIGNIKCRLRCDSPGVLVNGSIHWLIEKDKKKKKKKQKKKQNILAFDLLEEEFREIPLPRGLHTNTNFKIKELEGCLCGIDYRDKTRVLNMWKMKDYYMKNNEEEEEEDYWKKIFWIKWEGPEGYEHCFFWKKFDQALLWSNSSVVCTEIDDSVGPKVNAEDLSGARLFHGILHIKNLVSLTALGECNTKTIKDDRKRKRDSDKDEMNKNRKTKNLMKILYGRKPKKLKRGSNSSLKFKDRVGAQR